MDDENEVYTLTQEQIENLEELREEQDLKILEQSKVIQIQKERLTELELENF